jgi:hypothetical protein
MPQKVIVDLAILISDESWFEIAESTHQEVTYQEALESNKRTWIGTCQVDVVKTTYRSWSATFVIET